MCMCIYIYYIYIQIMGSLRWYVCFLMGKNHQNWGIFVWILYFFGAPFRQVQVHTDYMRLWNYHTIWWVQIYTYVYIYMYMYIYIYCNIYIQYLGTCGTYTKYNLENGCEIKHFEAVYGIYGKWWWDMIRAHNRGKFNQHEKRWNGLWGMRFRSPIDCLSCLLY
jgi:hypothetical protein